MNRLRHFPISFFATVMGIGGLGLAWKRAAHVLGAPAQVYPWIIWGAAGLWLLVATLWFVKALRHRHDVVHELNHPIRMPFAATITIGILLIATGTTQIAPELSRVLWWIGAIGHLGVTLVMLALWINRYHLRLGHVLPTWFIPIVGNLVAALAGPHVGSTQLSWFSFSVGLLMWIALLPLVLHRYLLHQDPVPAKLTPTFAIVIAPPAVALLAWQSLMPDQHGGPFTLMMGYAALFFLLLLLVQSHRIFTVMFAMPWWAHSFPLAAVTTSTIALADLHPGFLTVVAWTLLGGTTALVIGLVIRTSIAVARKEICVPE